MKNLLDRFTEVTADPDSLPKLNQKVITFSTEFPEDGFVLEELIGNDQTNKNGL